MKINQIILEMSAGTTGSGSVATVAKPMGGTQSRYPEVKGLKPVKSLAKQSKKKGPYSNSLSESKVEEAKLEEDDLIIVPGQSKRFKPGLIPKAQDRTDHEVEMALSDLYQAYKNAKKTYMLLKNRTEEEGLEGWVQEKIIKANDYLNAIREYYEHQSMQNEMTGGVVAAGGIAEGPKVYRMTSENAKKKVNPYAVGMSQAMKSTGDKPPLKKSTIVKGHKIAKKIKGEDLEEGWKSKLAGAALAGAAAFGGGGAHAGGMSLPPAGLTPAQSQEFAATQMAGQQAINQHAAQQAGKIDYRKDGPITQSSLGHKLEYGIPVNAKGDFINPNRLPNIHELPRDEIEAMAEAYQTWLKDYISRWPNAKQLPDGSMQAIKPGLAPMYPK
jgi:hypothetical protein